MKLSKVYTLLFFVIMLEYFFDKEEAVWIIK